MLRLLQLGTLGLLSGTLALQASFVGAQGVASSSSSSTSPIQVTITDGKTTVRKGDGLIYVINLTQSTQASRIVDIDLYLTQYVESISADRGGSILTNRVRWENVTLQQNQTQRFTVQMTVRNDTPEGSQLTARVVAEGYEGNDLTVVQSTPSQPATFQVSVTDDKQVVMPDQQLTYRISVKNDSTQPQTTDVVATLSQFIALDSLTPPAPYQSNTITWEDVSFSAGETKLFSMIGTVRRNAPEFASVHTQLKVGQMTATDSTSVQTILSSSRSSSSSQSSRSSSSSSRRGTPVVRNVLFYKNADSDEVLPGGTVRYTLFVQNVLLNTIDDAVVTDKFDPAIMTVANAGGGTIVSPGQLQWTLPRLLPGQVWQQSYTLAVSSSIKSGIQLSNVASITGSDVAVATLTEKVVTVKTNVVPRLPATGAPYDILFLSSIMPISLIGAVLQRYKKR